MRSCDPQELELPALFIYILTHTVCFWSSSWSESASVYSIFNFCFFLWQGMIGQSNAVYPDRLTPALV